MKRPAWLAAIRGAARPGAMDWLVVGLGNPGPRYAETRHNAGRRVVEVLARRHGVALDTVKLNAKYGIWRTDGRRVGLAVPLTYMNESGRAVGPLARFFRVPPECLLVAYDDFDLPLGRLRLRSEGGAGGQKGVASIIQSLGTDAFPRLRVGIGRPPAGWDAADYVLSRLGADERPIFDAALDDAADAVEAVLAGGISAAMNTFNRREG